MTAIDLSEYPDNTLVEIADSKGTSGMGIYEAIKKLEPKPEALRRGNHSSLPF